MCHVKLHTLAGHAVVRVSVFGICLKFHTNTQSRRRPLIIIFLRIYVPSCMYYSNSTSSYVLTVCIVLLMGTSTVVVDMREPNPVSDT
jgi:hypothetical protein